MLNLRSRRMELITLASLYMLGGAALGQGTNIGGNDVNSNTGAQLQISKDKITQYLNASPGLQDLMQKTKVSNQNALNSAVSAPTGFGEQVYNSPTFNEQALKLKENNKSTIEQTQTDQNLIDKLKANLPQNFDPIDDLRYGKHIVVSSSGGSVIKIIRALARATDRSRDDLLAELFQFSKAGVPEAQNYVGVIFELGLYGAKRDIKKATSFYQAAASKSYAAAILNLGLINIYGKNGENASPENGRILLSRAATLSKGFDEYRACGLASFLNYTNNQTNLAQEYATGCASPLANLVKVQRKSLTLFEKIKLLRDFSDLGANDAFGLLEQISKETIGTPIADTYCQWYLFNKYLGRVSQAGQSIRKDAQTCIERNFDKKASQDKKTAAVTATVANLNAEVTRLKTTRANNKFHYSWPVPYLAFNQTENELFYPLFYSANKQSGAIAQQKEILN